MSAEDRFLRSKRLVPFLAFATGRELSLLELEVSGEYQSVRHNFHGSPIILRNGERLVLEQARGRLTLYRGLR